MLAASPDDRLNVSLLDTLANVLGVVSLAAMLTISADAIFGGAARLALASRLWLFAVVYLGIARAVLVSVRRQAMRSEALCHADADRRCRRDRRPSGHATVRRAALRTAAGRLPRFRSDARRAPRRACLGAGARRPRRADRGDRRYRRPPRDPGLLARARPRAGRQGQGVPGARRDGLAGPRLYESINERTTLDHVGGLPLLTLHSVDPARLAVRDQARIDRGVALAGAVPAVAGAARVALARALVLAGPDLVPPAPGGTRRARVHDVSSSGRCAETLGRGEADAGSQLARRHAPPAASRAAIARTPASGASCATTRSTSCRS